MMMKSVSGTQILLISAASGPEHWIWRGGGGGGGGDMRQKGEEGGKKKKVLGFEWGMKKK